MSITATIIERVGRLAGFVTLLLAFVSLTGYELLYTFYEAFGIPIWVLDLPAYTFPFHSVVPLLLFGSFLGIAVVFVWLFMLGISYMEPPESPWFSSWKQSAELASYIVVAGCFFAAATISKTYGVKMAREYVSQNVTAITLIFKNPSPETSRDERLIKANGDGRLRMLTQTKDLVILYENIPKKRRVATYVIARSELSSIRSSYIETGQ